jgi:hypothetical protein
MMMMGERTHVCLPQEQGEDGRHYSGAGSRR